MERNKYKQKGTRLAQLNKSFSGGPGGWFFKKAPLAAGGTLLVVVLLFMPFFLQAADQYKLLSWEGEVKVRRARTFLRLKKKPFALQKGDAFWIMSGAMAEIRFPDGETKQIKGPRYNTVERLWRIRPTKQPSFLEIFIKKHEFGEIIHRAIDKSIGGTRASGDKVAKDFYEKVKKALPEMKGETLTLKKQNEVDEALAAVDRGIDASLKEMIVLLKAGVYKHFGNRKQALITAFNYYETIYDKKEKLYQQLLIEDFIFAHVLPVEITYSVDEQSYMFSRNFDNGPQVTIRFDSNFPVWWAAFSFDGKTLKEIEKTIDYAKAAQDTFTLKNRHMGKEADKPHQIFIITNYEWSELEKYDDIEVAKKELLESNIPETVSNTVRGFNDLILKINLSDVRRDLEEKMKRAAQISLQIARLLIGICL